MAKLFHRQKVLMAVLQSMGGTLSSVEMQKLLFLFCKEFDPENSYEFVPYKYGCFSFQSYADRRKLVGLGHLADGGNWEILDSRHIYSRDLDDRYFSLLREFNQKYSKIRGNKLVRLVYLNYPYFSSRSEIKDQILTKSEVQMVSQTTKPKRNSAFFTIGYEGSSFDNYLNRLISNNVHVLCDVRKNPISRKHGFSKSTLSKTLAKLAIEYVHLPNLGIDSKGRANLTTLKDYQDLFREYEKNTLRKSHNELEKITQLIREKKRVAITCFESSHEMCHRGRVANALADLPNWNSPIQHI